MKRMCWVPLLSVLLVFGIAVCCVGDQLQWNPLSVCVDAAERLAEATLWVSYCSLADGDFVELWLLRGFEILSTQATDLFELQVTATWIGGTSRPVSPDNVGASDIQWIVNDRVSLRGFTQGVDLAYVYVHTGGNVFWCLGRELGLDCHVELERITLADAILASLVATGCQRSHIIPQGYDALRAPWALPRL